MFQNQYQGFSLPCSHWRVPRVVIRSTATQGGGSPSADIEQVSIDEFFHRFIVTRTPCIIKHHLQDPLWHGDRWSYNFLLEKAGDSLLKIEKRMSPSSILNTEQSPSERSMRFGTGDCHQMMTLSQFLTDLKNGDDSLYLTTQDIPLNKDGKALAVVTPPLSHLTDDFPVKPSLVGPGLVPQSINCWIGNSIHGTSSGLHHDFHDNIYVLLQGKKRFILLSPCQGPRLYVRGNARILYPNGRYVYSDGEERAAVKVRDDGADIGHVAQWKLSVAMKRVDELEQNLSDIQNKSMKKNKNKNNKKLNNRKDNKCENEEDERVLREKLEVAEDDVGAAMTELLLLKRNKTARGNGKSSKSLDGDVDVDDDVDDVDDDEDDCLDDEFLEDDFQMSDEEVLPISSSKSQDLVVEEDATSVVSSENSVDPVSFSTIPVSLLHQHVFSSITPLSTVDSQPTIHPQSTLWTSPPDYSQFPLLSDAIATSVEINRGEMLYLPAGWFHEVSSFSSTESSGYYDSSTSSSSIPHIALNYWFHPPTTSNINHPYIDDYWKDDWIRLSSLLHQPSSIDRNKNVNGDESSFKNCKKQKI